MSTPYREPSPPVNVRTLCRLLVDPKKVRVRVRWRGDRDEWEVFITTSHAKPTRGYQGTGERVERAIIKALLLAKKGRMDGVDLSMSWSLEHPFGRVTDYDRRVYAGDCGGDRTLVRDVTALLAGELT